MNPPDPPKPGDPLEASWGNNLIGYVRELGMTVTGPLRVVRSGRRTTLTLDTGDLSLFGFAVIKTSSSVTGRTGATPGSGSAKVQKWNGTSLSDGAGTITVRTIAAGGHATGKYGFAAKLFGLWWILSLEC